MAFKSKRVVILVHGQNLNAKDKPSFLKKFKKIKLLFFIKIIAFLFFAELFQVKLKKR
ncbi:MAG: hypothetical protein WAX77_12850 [Methylococcaceae bacterium]